MIYYLLSISSLFFSLINCSIRKNKFYVILIFSMLMIIFFRGDVGTDYKAYISLWNNIVQGVSSWNKEFGFVFTVRLSWLIGLQAYQYYIVLCSLTIYVFFVSVRKFNSDLLVALTIYISFIFLSYTLNAMRQSLSMSLFLLCFYYFLNRKRSISTIFLALSISFHYVSVLIVPLFFWLKIKFRFIFISLFLSALFGYFFTFKLAYLILSVFSSDKVVYYLVDNSNDLSILNLVYRSLILFIMLLVCNIKKDELLIQMTKVYAFGVFWYFLLFPFDIVATRILLFFSIIIPVFIARFVKISDNYFNRYVVFLIFFVILIPNLYIQISSGDFDFVTRY